MKTIHPEHLDIHIDEKAGRLFFPTKANQDAELLYKLHTDSKPTAIEFTHTFVPVALRNAGLGSRLVNRGLRLAKENGYEVIPTCSFVKKHIEMHPEFQQLVAAEAAQK